MLPIMPRSATLQTSYRNLTNMKNSTRKNDSGFTLVEIMIVVAIIALLAAIAVPNFLRARKRSQATRILEDLRVIDAACDQYAIETNKGGGAAVAWNDIQSMLIRLRNKSGYNRARSTVGWSCQARTCQQTG